MKRLLILIILFVSVSTFAQSDTSVILSDIDKSVQEILNEVQKTNQFLNNSEEIKKLKAEKLELEEKIQNLENNKSFKKYNNWKEEKEDIEKDLQVKKESLSKFKQELDTKISEIDSLNTKIAEKNQTIKSNAKDKENTKIFIRQQIEFIIKQKSGTLSENLLVDLSLRSRTYSIDQNLITKLKRYIELQNILVEAKKVLNASFNSKNIKDQINNLDNLDFSSFDLLDEEMDILYSLLEDYEGKCTSLSEKLEEFTELSLDNKTIQNILNRIKNEYKEYPYLLKQINNKINKPKQSISIDCN